MKRTSMILAALGLTAGIANAQEAGTAQTLLEVEQDAMMVSQVGLTVDEIEDADIYNADGEMIGEVDDVLMTPEGEVVAVSADIGGFLGIGDRDVVIPLDRLTFATDRFTTDLSGPELEGLDVWDD